MLAHFYDVGRDVENVPDRRGGAAAKLAHLRADGTRRRRLREAARQRALRELSVGLFDRQNCRCPRHSIREARAVNGRTPRYASLDHWRGFAAIAVLIFHGFGAVRGAGLDVHSSLVLVKSASDLGWLGVHLFFVISGYCIAAKVDGVVAAGEGSWQFAKDRFLRIYLPYWAACVFAARIGIAALPFNAGTWAGTVPSSLSSLVSNILLVEPYTGADPLLLVSWSLVFEMGFYLIVACGLALYSVAPLGRSCMDSPTRLPSAGSQACMADPCMR